MSDNRYHQLYNRLMDEVTALYQANQQRIHKGLWGMIIVLVLYLVLLFVTQGSKAIILLLWILTMFALAAYLITIEYLNHELKKKLEHITQTELDLGPAAADPVAEANLAKLRGMIAERPSLVNVILRRLESDEAESTPDGEAAVEEAEKLVEDAEKLVESAEKLVETAEAVGSSQAAVGEGAGADESAPTVENTPAVEGERAEGAPDGNGEDSAEVHI